MRLIDEETLDRVSAIWMLACKDRDALITYRSIVDRFPSWQVKERNVSRQLTEEDVRKLVKDHGELFSPLVATNWFKDWQNWVIDGGHYPGWVIKLHPDPDPPDPARQVEINKLRKKEIMDLKREDVFRCQLRTDTRPPPDRPDPCVRPCDTDEVNLGLEHLDRLRKAGAEAREEGLKRVTGLIVPALAILVSGLVSAGSVWWSTYTARQSARVAAAEAEVKLWDLAARERGDAYESTLDAMQLAFDAAEQGDAAEARKHLTRIRFNLYRLEQVIDEKTSRDEIWRAYEGFGTFCSNRLNAGRGGSAPDPDAALKFRSLRDEMHDRLYNFVLTQGPYEFNPYKELRDIIVNK